ncbi:MAG: hypothetical protein AB8G22_15120 [Saprospiraceae bacterium]
MKLGWLGFGSLKANFTLEGNERRYEILVSGVNGGKRFVVDETGEMKVLR